MLVAALDYHFRPRAMTRKPAAEEFLRLPWSEEGIENNVVVGIASKESEKVR
jgi:hypothetical protein